MNQLHEIRILLPEDKESVLAFASALAELEISDPIERELQSWSSRSRPEALDHYLRLGWSYGAFDINTGQLLGFLLAQPLLFYRGLTQTVWVEELAHKPEDLTVALELLNTAYRWARDKHVQCLLLESDSRSVMGILPQWEFANRAHTLNAPLIEVRSSKLGGPL